MFWRDAAGMVLSVYDEALAGECDGSWSLCAKLKAERDEESR
jgi:hypothetical protein